MLFLLQKTSDRPAGSRSTSCQAFECFNRVGTNVGADGKALSRPSWLLVTVPIGMWVEGGWTSPCLVAILAGMMYAPRWHTLTLFFSRFESILRLIVPELRIPSR